MREAIRRGRPRRQGGTGAIRYARRCRHVHRADTFHVVCGGAQGDVVRPRMQGHHTPRRGAARSARPHRRAMPRRDPPIPRPSRGRGVTRAQPDRGAALGRLACPRSAPPTQGLAGYLPPALPLPLSRLSGICRQLEVAAARGGRLGTCLGAAGRRGALPRALAMICAPAGCLRTCAGDAVRPHMRSRMRSPYIRRSRTSSIIHRSLPSDHHTSLCTPPSSFPPPASRPCATRATHRGPRALHPGEGVLHREPLLRPHPQPPQPLRTARPPVNAAHTTPGRACRSGRPGPDRPPGPRRRLHRAPTAVLP